MKFKKILLIFLIATSLAFLTLGLNDFEFEKTYDVNVYDTMFVLKKNIFTSSINIFL